MVYGTARPQYWRAVVIIAADRNVTTDGRTQTVWVVTIEQTVGIIVGSI